MAKKVNFTAGRTENNYSAVYTDESGVVAVVGDTLRELKEEAVSALVFHIEGLKEDGETLPEALQGEYELVFTFDTQSMLSYYSNIFTRAALSRLTGINEKQLGHYIQGIHKPRKDKSKKIEKALHDLGEELLSVELT